MFQKEKDVVMTVGSKVVQKSKALYSNFLNKFLQKTCETKAVIKQTFEKAIEGEYLGKGGLVAAGTGAFACAGNALAAVPASVTTAITDAVADVGTIGAAILGVIIVIAAFNWRRKPIH